MSSLTNWISRDIPNRWADLFGRSVMVAVVAFVVLQLKEFFDASLFDTAGTGADALLIALGYFLLNAILMRVKA